MQKTLTDTERLNFINQFTILHKLSPDSHYIHCIEILKNGYVSEYNEVFKGLNSEIPTNITTETSNILKMYRSLIWFANQKNKELLTKIDFEGFDLSTEYDHWSYADFLINTLNRFTEIKDLDCDENLNSHSSKLNTYRRKLDIWNKYGQPNWDGLNTPIALEILSA